MFKNFDQMNLSEKANCVLALLERAKERDSQRREALSGPPAPLLVFPKVGKVVNSSTIRTLKARDGHEITPPTCEVFELGG